MVQNSNSAKRRKKTGSREQPPPQPLSLSRQVFVAASFRSRLWSAGVLARIPDRGLPARKKHCASKTVMNISTEDSRRTSPPPTQTTNETFQPTLWGGWEGLRELEPSTLMSVRDGKSHYPSRHPELVEGKERGWGVQRLTHKLRAATLAWLFCKLKLK